MDWSLLLMLAVFFLATFIRSAVGFGDALVAVPLLALMMPIEVVVPVTVLISITVAAVIISQDWRDVHFRSAGWLIFATLFGTPLGLFLLVTLDERIIKGILAVILIGFSWHSLLRRKLPLLKNDRLAFIFGFSAGILGGAYGMNGPPLVIYGSLRGWSPQHFRATLQGYFLPASLMVMCGYWFAGLWTPTVTRHYFRALPAVVVAFLLGRVVNRRLSENSFTLYVHIGLLIAGALLLWQSADICVKLTAWQFLFHNG